MSAKPILFVRKGEELPLSGESLTNLLRAVLDRGRPFRFRARGFSMAPFIKDNDVVTISPLGSRRPKTGVVAAFIHPRTGKVAVHRIVLRKSDCFYLKGDSGFDVDGPLPGESILGAVTRVERAGKEVRLAIGPGRAVVALLSRWGWLTRFLLTVRQFLRRNPKGISR